MALAEKYVSSLAAGGGSGTSGSPWTWAEMLTTAAAGDRVNVKQDGTYARTTNADAFTNNGTSTQPIIVRGYKTTIGDGYQGRGSGGKGTLDTSNMPVITYTTGRFNNSAKSNIVLESLNITASALDEDLLDLGGTSIVKSCTITNNHSGTSAVGIKFGGNNGAAIDCDVTCSGASSLAGIYIIATGIRVVGCRLKCVGGAAALGAANRSAISDSILFASVDGFKGLTSMAAWEVTINDCTIYGCTTGVNLPSGTVTNIAVVTQCAITDCTTGISVGTDGPVITWGNRYRNNGADTATITDWHTGTNWNPTTGSGSHAVDFVDAPNGDFRIQPASSLRKAAPGYKDIGALTYQGANLTELTGPINTAAMSIEDGVMWLVMQHANRRDTAEGTDGDVVYNAAGAGIAEADTSDDGTTFTRAKYGAA